MGDESVIFEIQLEKKVLEQVFRENKHLKDSYNKLVETEERTSALQDENKNLKQINRDLIDENNDLKARIKQLEQNRRIFEERNKSCDLNVTESNLLKMKLQKSETERSRIAQQFENETKMLDELIRDNSKLQKIENELNETKQNFVNVSEELKRTKKQLTKVETEYRELDKDKLNLEREMKNLIRKLRLEEERNKSNDLAQVECKLLKLKLYTIEHEKNYLQEEFERERKIITKQSKPRVAKLEENIRHLRKWIEKETRERRPRDTEEVKALKAQIQSLESDQIDLIEGFELERKVFRKILKNNGHDMP